MADLYNLLIQVNGNIDNNNAVVPSQSSAEGDEWEMAATDDNDDNGQQQ